MTIFLTGATGYIGSYIAHGLLEEHGQRLALLVRAGSDEEARQRLWKSLQLHMSFEQFQRHIDSNIDIYRGDLTDASLGLEPAEFKKLAHSIESVIHCAASLNRKSSKACFNVNLRGTLEVVKLARAAQDHHGLRRFSDISTVAVAGHRNNETVTEAEIIDWNRSDYDPYARTKKFCEHMVHELLPEVPITIFRPSTVLGDSRFPETTQFDMVRAFVFLAKLPALPFRPEWRMDIVPANYVGAGVVAVHMQDKPEFDSYNLSSGERSLNYRQIVAAMSEGGHGRPAFVPLLEKPFSAAVERLMATPRKWGIAPAASLMKVFLPYLTNDTVFDSSRIQSVLGHAPAPFSEYCYGLFDFATGSGFSYPYKPWPTSTTSAVSEASEASDPVADRV